jgi:hypothetical protein
MSSGNWKYDYLDRLYEMDREDYEKMRKAYLINKTEDDTVYKYTEVIINQEPKKYCNCVIL